MAVAAATLFVFVLAASQAVVAQKKYDAGATDTEITIDHANVMKQAASLDLELGMLRPGIRVTTNPTDYQPIKQLFLIRFDGQDWVPLGQATGN